MHPILRAAFAAALLAAAAPGHAEGGSQCPSLPADSGLAWEKLDGPGFTFCKALRTDDGSQVFAVMLGRESPFKPRRGDRAEEDVIDGHPVRWYSGAVASTPDVLVRETLVEIDGERLAHISLRAGDQDALAAAMRQVQALRFQDARLSSN